MTKIEMVNDLKNSIIFLHGLSGSGKGEVYRKLAEKYSSNGYSVVYLSSGVLFRAALSDPVIAAQVRSGYFLDTLGAIMPGIQEVFRRFFDQWQESNGKAVIILDGVIRRGSYVKEGVQIPSQLQQISEGIAGIIDHKDLDKALAEAIHIVVDISPEDAEAQMINRAFREIESIKTQLAGRFSVGQLDREKFQTAINYISDFESVLKREATKEDQVSLARGVKTIREDLSEALGLDRSATIADAFGKVGVFTELREDDISPVGRNSRIDNYVKRIEEDGKTTYEAGFATQALCDLGFKFLPNGSFGSEGWHLLTIPNGRSKGINLEQFRKNCEVLASSIYVKMETRRELVFENAEGQRRFKEK